MKRILFSLLSIFLFANIQAQIETNIIGTWRVADIQSNKGLKLTEKEQKKMKTLKKAVFQFTEDHRAKVKLFLSSHNVSDGYWYYNEQKNVIVITDWDDHKVDRMRLWYEELEDGNLEFYVDDTPFVMTMTKDPEKQ
jgi:hypothetical protein